LRAAAQLVRHGRQAQCVAASCRIAGPCAQRLYATDVDESKIPAATIAQDHFIEPPVTVYGIPGRYASALFSAAAKGEALEQVEAELTEVYNMAVESPDFERFLSDPTVPREAKKEGLAAIFDELKFSDITKRFVELLAENNRLDQLDKISDTFDDIMAAVRGEVKATITTAEEIEPQQLEDIKKGLSQALQEGETLLLQERIDPTIIGGFVIDIGDKHIDMSISSRVKKVQQMILETTA